MKIFSPLLLILFFCSILTFSQEKIIVLSNKVGERVEKEAALKYLLFQSIKNFNSAVIKQNDSEFRADVEVWRGNKLIDSSFSLTYGGIINMANLIEYSDEISNGNYNISNKEIKLFYSDGTPLQTKRDTTAYLYQTNKNVETFKRNPSGSLPFINNPGRIKFIPSIRWGAGIGIATFPFKISGENEFKQKLNITNLTPDDISEVTFSFTGFLEWKTFSLECEYAGNSNFSKTNLGINYLFKDIVNDFITPFAGVSIGSLKFTRIYRSGDSIETSPGYKNQLLEVDLNNNTLAYNIMAGIDIGNHDVGLSLGVGHTWVSIKNGTGSAELFTVDLSGFYFEARLKLYFGEY